METSAFITADMDNFYIALAETSAFLNSVSIFRDVLGFPNYVFSSNISHEFHH